MKKNQVFALLLVAGVLAVPCLAWAEDDNALSVVNEVKADAAADKKSEIEKAPESEVIPAPPTSEIVKAEAEKVAE